MSERSADEAGFDAFYAATSARLVRALHAYTGDRAEAQDAVQEAYARAWERWDRVRSDDSPEAWVRTVAWRVAASRAQRAKVGLPDVAERPEPTPTAQPSRSAAPPPSAEPSVSPTPGSDATPGESGPRVPVQELLLDAAAADRAEPGAWMPGEPVKPPLLDPCDGGTDYPRDAERTDTAATSLRTVEEEAGIDVRQTLARYPSEAAAADAAAGYERAVRGCPGAAQDPQSSEPGYQVVFSQQSDGLSTVFIRMSQGVIYASYVAVQHRGDLVSVLAVGYGGDGDPGAEAIEPFLPEVAALLTSPDLS